ncbi:imidazolonepropionase [Ramlibacter sp. USB13]|uniref:Imidazolonepropionase n=1 Tax=Ramlibacter cellulosilyticus TaxID=2764187 RepID=A0A923MRJ6_9BURK|nr:imidazolonepropionase [Ramlibacter cellulosilyticus]MBC5783908.1 imidazolonepropionase [Ramlibacter cellulosilyticus]
MNIEVWSNARITTMAPDATVPYGLVDDAALAVEGGRIAWVGPRAELPAALRHGAVEHDAQGALLTPGLVDCHTHLVWGGDRAAEFEARLNGATYEEIARAGGGIVSTVKATREASEEELLLQSLKRLRPLLAEGVTTIEIKSGYGLDEANEAKCLRVARRLGERENVAVRTTFLGAHALPPEFRGRADDYIAEVCRMLPRLHAQGLVDAVDAFCENIGFSLVQTRRVFEAAQALGLPVKLHAEQLSDSAGAELAASFGALSCDHLEWLGEEGAQAMARAGTVAVLLPGAFYFLRETKLPPVALLREHQVPIAVSTDCNPGTSPCTSLLLMLNMACTLFRLTPEEAFAGITRNAARALGLADRGVLAPGLRADFVLWDARSPAELAYALGANPRLATIVEGTER